MSKSLVVAVGAVAMAVLVGCGSSSKSTSTNAASVTEAPTTVASAPTAPASTVPPITMLGLRSTALGQIVVDPKGWTVYMFDKDVAGSGRSACEGACASEWPPVLTTGLPTKAAGIGGTPGTLTRAEGAQVTLDGHPLYRFSGDTAPGDTKGNGVGKVWHVVPAAGPHTAETSAPAATNAPVTNAPVTHAPSGGPAPTSPPTQAPRPTPAPTTAPTPTTIKPYGY